jgi:hypothetical protein
MVSQSIGDIVSSLRGRQVCYKHSVTPSEDSPDIFPRYTANCVVPPILPSQLSCPSGILLQIVLFR